MATKNKPTKLLPVDDIHVQVITTTVTKYSLRVTEYRLKQLLEKDVDKELPLNTCVSDDCGSDVQFPLYVSWSTEDVRND